MLDRFCKAKAAEIAALCECAAKGTTPRPFVGKRPSFIGSLKAKTPLAVIAEYKRASPSKGDINLGLEPEQAAAAYAWAGAGALSVLTEQEHFKGDMAYLERMVGPGLPLLRKDFILHPVQVDQTAASPASALLLIARMLDDAMLRALLFRSLDLGLTPVTEVFDETDLRRARAAGASVIQVNSRDLDTLAVDLALSRRLAPFKQANEFWITASGISTRSQLLGLLDLGYDAALIGSSLMGGDPGRKLAGLLQGGNGRA
jgi:indole-3-glycerol phosphate synthase